MRWGGAHQLHVGGPHPTQRQASLRAWHGPVLHPGAPAPEVETARSAPGARDKGDIRVRRWNAPPFCRGTPYDLDGCALRPIYQRPCGRDHGAGADDRGILRAYPYRWPWKQFLCDRIPPRWRCQSLERQRLLSDASVVAADRFPVQAIAAATDRWRWGHGIGSDAFGRTLANHLDIHVTHFSNLAPPGRNQETPSNLRYKHINEVQHPKAADW